MLNPENLTADYDLTPVQRLLFWRVAASGGGLWLKSLTPIPKPAVRRALEKQNLLVQKQARDPQTGRSATRLEITDHGWEWAQANMGGAFAATPAAAETLSVLLSAMSKYLDAQGLQAVDLFTELRSRAKVVPFERPESPIAGVEEDSDTPSQMIDASVVRQILTLASGRPGVEVPLKALRLQLDLNRMVLDESLTRLHREGRVELTTVSKPSQLSAEDREAAVLDEQGKSFHLVQLSHQIEFAY